MTVRPATAADCRRHVLMFLPRFHDPIRAGTKTQTIRGRRKREVRPGDVLSLRGWVGKPYRNGSTHEDLLPAAVCLSVTPLLITFDETALGLITNVAGIRLGCEWLPRAGVHRFVAADGFDGVSDFIQHWAARPTPRGAEPGRDLVVIRWAPLGDEP